MTGDTGDPHEVPQTDFSYLLGCWERPRPPFHHLHSDSGQKEGTDHLFLPPRLHFWPDPLFQWEILLCRLFWCWYLISKGILTLDQQPSNIYVQDLYWNRREEHQSQLGFFLVSFCGSTTIVLYLSEDISSEIWRGQKCEWEQLKTPSGSCYRAWPTSYGSGSWGRDWYWGSWSAHQHQTTQDKANWSEFSLVVIITIKSKIIFLYLIPPSTLGTANKSMSCSKVNHRQFWMGTNTHSWLFLSVSKP